MDRNIIFFSFFKVSKKYFIKFYRNLYQNAFSVFLVLIVFTSLYVLHRNKFEIYYNIGNTMFGGVVLGQTFYDIDSAEYFLTQANQKKEPKIWTNYQLSRINFIRGDFPHAIYFANEELRLYPKNCRTHYIRGLTYGYMNKLDQAIADFEIFNACFPDTWAGHNDLAWFWFRKGDMKKVIEVIEHVINKDNNATSPWLQNTYGVALMNVGRYFEAETALHMAKYLASNMTEEGWGKSYPGNNPEIYGEGLTAMRQSINKNLLILKEKKAVVHK